MNARHFCRFFDYSMIFLFSIMIRGKHENIEILRVRLVERLYLKEIKYRNKIITVELRWVENFQDGERFTPFA